MIRRPPRSTLDRSSAASDVYKRQGHGVGPGGEIDGHGRGVARVESAEGVALFGAQLHPTDITDPYGGAIRAVSYTHLRAHETVLDLVCRLLLEKKKTIEI